MIAIDTNLLVYAHRAGLPEHRLARRAIERASRDPRGWGIAMPSIAEFWGIVTHPESRGGPSTSEQAFEFLHALIAEAGGQLWMPREGFWRRLLQTATHLKVQGPRIFDLQIGLTAFDNGATEIWTHDRRFVTLPGLLVHDPFGRTSRHR
jgi:predicted nucleic acid-binding protein